MGPGRPDFRTGSAHHDSTGEHIAESCDEFDNRFASGSPAGSPALPRQLADRAAVRLARLLHSPLEGHTSGQVTLCASVDEATVATITATLDSPTASTSAGSTRTRSAAAAEGRKLCEFTKLAVDESVRSQAILGAIFHVACIYVINLHRCSDVLIEVNPRHVRFYERMLGFRARRRGTARPAVNAPAVLMRLDLAHCAAEIARLGGLRARPRDASARSIRISSPRATRSRSSAGCASTELRREGPRRRASRCA